MVPANKRRTMYTEVRKLLAAMNRYEQAEKRALGRLEKHGLTIRELAVPETTPNSSRRAIVMRVVRKVKKNENRQERARSHLARISKGMVKKYNNFMNIPTGNLERLLRNSLRA